MLLRNYKHKYTFSCSLMVQCSIIVECEFLLICVHIALSSRAICMVDFVFCSFADHLDHMFGPQSESVCWDVEHTYVSGDLEVGV